MPELNVEIWSDVACPWCYVGKRHFEAALSAFEHRAQLRVQFRSFELDPSAPPKLGTAQGYVERLAAKYGTGVAGAQAMIDQMTARGAKNGIHFHFERLQSCNTFLAHQLLHWALSQTLPATTDGFPGVGAQAALKERLLRAYFSEGAAISEGSTLVALAADIGLDEEAAHNALAAGSFVQDVRQDQQTARELGISGVPFFVIGRYGVSGAQPATTLTEVLHKAWNEAETSWS